MKLIFIQLLLSVCFFNFNIAQSKKDQINLLQLKIDSLTLDISFLLEKQHLTDSILLSDRIGIKNIEKLFLLEEKKIDSLTQIVDELTYLTTLNAIKNYDYESFISSVYNDELVFSLETSLQNVYKSFDQFSISKVEKENEYDESIKDTLINSDYKASHFESYYSTIKNEKYFFLAEIFDDNFTILNSVKIGMPINSFEKEMKINVLNNSVRLLNSEGGSREFIFIFKFGYLKAIYYYGYLN